MFKKTIAASFLALTFNVFAGDISQSASKINSLSADITTLADRIDYGNSRPQAQTRLKRKLNQLINEAKTLRGMLSGTPSPRPRPRPRPIPRPGPGHDLYSAKCHIDDDYDFSYDQEVIDVSAHSVQGLISECQLMARSMYNSQAHSSGLKDIILNAAVPRGMQTGVCHIDDDPDMSFNQVVQGTLIGNSMLEIVQDCKALAQHAYGDVGSSGLDKVNQSNVIPSNAVTGTCHIDDDPDMTFNQKVMGTVFGNTVADISQDCKDLAFDAYGSQGSSGLKDIRR